MSTNRILLATASLLLLSKTAFASDNASLPGGLTIGSLVVAGIVVVIALVIVAVIALIMKQYIKVPPNQAAIISGRRHKLSDNGDTIGYRIVQGGATFLIPVIERADYLSLEVMNIPIVTTDAITREGVPLTVRTIANVKIGGDEGSLRNAAERFLGQDDAKIRGIVSQTLEAHLRSICGTLSVEEINNDRQQFSQKMVSEAMGDLKKLGIVIDAWAVQHIEDTQGYLTSLGKRRIAEVKRDASIGEAKALRDGNIQTAEANSEALTKSSEAQRAGEVAKNQNLALIAQAERDRAVKQAQFDATIATEKARTEQAGPLAKAEAERAVLVARVESERAKVEAEIRLQETHAARREAELKATVVKQAEADRQTQIIEAEGERQAAVIKAGGEKEAAVLSAEAVKLRTIAEGEANAMKIKALGLAEAETLKAKLIAEAEANKAKLLAAAEGEAAMLRQRGNAEAEAVKAKLLAEAEGTKAKLLAEAEGVLKKAEAFQQLDQAGRFMSILEHAPAIIEALGTAGNQVVEPAFRAIGAGLGNIERLSIVDTGSGSDGASALSRLAGTAPEVFFGALQKAKALGFKPEDLLAKIGIKLEDIGITVTPKTPALPAEAAPAKSE